MERDFLSPRWFGRLMGLLLTIAREKNIRFNNPSKVTFIELLVSVMDKCHNYEKVIITQLKDKWSEQKQYEQRNNIIINADENKMLEDKGIKEVTIIKHNYNNYNRLLDEVDFYAIEKAKKEQAMIKRKKITKISLISIAIVIIVAIIYNLPYFKEHRFYKTIETAKSEYKINQYYTDFPNGRHYEDVMLIHSNISGNPIKIVMDYVNNFPEGKYINVMNAKCDSLWDEVIAKYENRDKTNESPEAVRFMTEMLYHLKRNRKNTVVLDINPKIDLLDYEDYDDEIRTYLEDLYSEETLPLKENLVSLKDNFTQSNEYILVEILKKGLVNSFSRMFSEDFINIVSDDDNGKSPVLTFNYNISNQISFDFDGEKIIVFPNIWIYSTTYNNIDIPQNYLLGIDVYFEVNFTIPESDVTYTYNEMGSPGESIYGIQNIKDGYKQMTQICFAKFADMMANSLGLERSYFDE